MYSSATAFASASVSTSSPRIAVFVASPFSFSPRRTGTASSSVWPATKRAAPSFIPKRFTNRCTSFEPAATRISLRARSFRSRRIGGSLRAEQRQLGLTLAAEHLEVDLDAADPARLGERRPPAA